ncbi:hypothetical protein FI667_g1333, partial [Globisporangium splendens]
MASNSPPVEKSAPSSSAPAVSSSSMKSPGSVAFSSAPVAPVVVNSHNRRQSEAASWSQTPAALAADGGGGCANTRQQSMKRNGGSRGSSPGSFGSSEPSDASGDEEDRSQHSESHPSRQSSATLSLPAISGAALLQLRSGNNSIQPAEKRGDAQYASGSSGAGGMAAPGRSSGYYRRSQSRSRERPDSTDVHNRWRNADPQPSTTSSQGETSSKAHPHIPQHDSNSREDAGSPAFSASSGMRGSADPSSPDDREIRIMFHGREIYADDLIGLRVAKTFVGHGRFLGQVVKFDEPTSLYTIVYADGDAEELNIDSTIQILIQDEIERADPSLPPVSSAYAKEAYATPNSPESTRTSAPSGMPQAPPQSSLQQRPSPPPIAQHVPPPPSSRPLVQISEREAQFVVGLFENHALPALLRDGWRIQMSASGTEQRFFAPPGNFPGAGGVFPTALSVVELIASDNELLSMCFPTNVHSAILSLFPESSRVLHESSHPRKRASSGHGDADAYDGKRQRAAREDSGHGSTAPQVCGVAPLNPRSRGMNVEQPRGSYVSEDMHRDRDREPYAADRVLPLSSSSVDRFGPGRQQSVQDRSGDDYRRGPPPGDSMRGAPSDIPGSSRWHGGGGGGHGESGVPDYRQQAYANSPGWRNREMVSSRGGPYAPPSSSSYPDGPSHRMQSRPDEPSSQYGDRSQPHPTMRPGPGSADGSSYRYHDSPARGSPGGQQQPLHRRVSSGGRSMPPSSSDDQGQTSRNELSAEYRNAGNVVDRHALRRGDPSGGPTVVSSNSSVNNRGPSFSMMDVDRNSHPRVGIPSSSASLMEHARAVSDSSKHPKWDSQHQQRRRPEQQGYDQQREHGRSLHVSESDSNQGYVPPPGHHHRHHGHHQVPIQHHRQHHHQRSASNYDSSKGSGAPSSTVASGGRVSTGMSDHRTGSPGNNQNTAADAPPPPHQM